MVSRGLKPRGLTVRAETGSVKHQARGNGSIRAAGSVRLDGVVTAMSGRIGFRYMNEKNCLPALPWCGTMILARLGNGRPAAHRRQMDPAHEPADGPTRR
jgi:hypothetical protein